jgi:hypothetical protein
MQVVLRDRWLYVRTINAVDKHSKQFTAGSCLPPLPKELPGHVSPDEPTALPLYKPTDEDTRYWEYTHIPVIAAIMSDAAATTHGVQRDLNFAPRQLQAVSNMKRKFLVQRGAPDSLA